MKNFDLKTFLIAEILLLIMVGFFSFDFIGKNFNEFNGICAQNWPKDQKQFEICMQPYYREIGIAKHARNITIGALVLLPMVYVFKRNRNKK